MQSKWAQNYLSKSSSEKQFLLFGLLTLLSIFVGIATEMYFLAGLPALALLGYIAIVDFKQIFYLLLFCVPLSTEVSLPGGIGTDLPTEPLMVALLFIYLLFILKQGREAKTNFVLHPITLILLLHVFWVYATTITSELFLVSLKFSLAKTWYVVVFFFMAGSLIKKEEDFKRFFWIIFIPLLFTVVVTMIRHYGYGFSFKDIHKVLHPFQRNHVNYAAVLALFFPLVFLARAWYEKRSYTRLLLNGTLVILLVAIYLSYTRAAYVALIIALAAYYIFEFRLIRYALFAALLAGAIAISSIIQHNNYLDYAPNYDRTITHKNFDNLIEATYKMEDISTMERVYRWVAGFHMSGERPLFGFGPGNFVNFYKSYTVTSFQTYVSDNEEKSGVHSYYLMTLVEQGFIGLVLFLVFSFYVLIKGEEIYHQTQKLSRKRIIMMVLLCTIVIDAFLIINDLIETDKIGPFFFICAAVLINMDLANRLDAQKNTEQA